MKSTEKNRYAEKWLVNETLSIVAKHTGIVLAGHVWGAASSMIAFKVNLLYIIGTNHQNVPSILAHIVQSIQILHFMAVRCKVNYIWRKASRMFRIIGVI